MNNNYNNPFNIPIDFLMLVLVILGYIIYKQTFESFCKVKKYNFKDLMF